MKILKLNSKGISLAEVMVAVGIGTVLIGIAGFILVQATESYQRTLRQYEAESELLSTMHVLQNTFARANFITYGGVAGNEANKYSARKLEPDQATEGHLYRYSSKVAGDGIFLVALADVEMGSANQSTFYGAGLFFQKPGITSSGALYLDSERDTQNDGSDRSGGWVHLSPRNSLLAYGRLVDFSVENISVRSPDGKTVKDAGDADIGKPVLSAEFKLTMRYFTRGAASQWRWCLASEIKARPECDSKAAFYDVEKKMKMTFVNNLMHPKQSPSARTVGNFYFFKSIGPSTR